MRASQGVVWEKQKFSLAWSPRGSHRGVEDIISTTCSLNPHFTLSASHVEVYSLRVNARLHINVIRLSSRWHARTHITDLRILKKQKNNRNNKRMKRWFLSNNCTEHLRSPRGLDRHTCRYRHRNKKHRKLPVGFLLFLDFVVDVYGLIHFNRGRVDVSH